jgi:hypothetical protein
MLVQLAEIDAGHAKATAEATTWAIKADAEFADRLSTADQAHRRRVALSSDAAADAWRKLGSEHDAAASALGTLATRLLEHDIREAVAAAAEPAAEPVMIEPDPRAVTSAARGADDSVRQAWRDYQADAASRQWLSLPMFALVLLVVIVLAMFAAWVV